MTLYLDRNNKLQLQHKQQAGNYTYQKNWCLESVSQEIIKYPSGIAWVYQILFWDRKMDDPIS